MKIRTRAHGPHVVIVTIDNQVRLNAMSRQMMTDLARLWDELERGTCRCVVLTGAGERTVCAGGEMSGDVSAAPEPAPRVSNAWLKEHGISKPIFVALS